MSTEKQEVQGHSLETQREQITGAVKEVGGRIVEWYGGQEHAMPGWEHAELDRLLTDAGRKRFDAVMITHPDRWSRDNVKSETGLNVLKDAGVAFYALTTKQDLYDPTVRLYLGLSAQIGAYHASLQSKKSLEVRIARAKRGFPSCGKLPYGRTFDKETGKWGIAADAQKLVEDVACRYIAGESMAEMAGEYGLNPSFLHKTLTTGCGPVWEQTFRSPKLGIDERIQTTVSALLEPKVIAAVRRHAEANKTFRHGHLKRRYLLSRMVFCKACGYAMSGETNPREKRYYRHQSRNGARKCPLPFLPWVPAEPLEQKVLTQLADLWGNPRAVEEALLRAEPNRAEVAKKRQRLERMRGELEKVRAGRERILSFVARDTISDVQATSQLESANEKEAKLVERIEAVECQLAGTLSADERQGIARQAVSAKRWVLSHNAEDVETMTYEQKRTLMEDVFGGKMPDGRRMGVYVEPIDTEPGRKHRRWRYEIRGKIQAAGTVKEKAGTSSSSYLQKISSPCVPFVLVGTTEQAAS